VVGRGSQKLKLKGATVFPSALKAVLDSVPQVTNYVIVARRGDSGADRVEVRVACDGKSDGMLEALRERFQGAVKVVPDITRAPASEIDALQMPAESRKRRYFVDLRQPVDGGPA